MTKNVQVSETWVKNAYKLVLLAQLLCESARDGRPVPEWLTERLKPIEQLLEEM